MNGLEDLLTPDEKALHDALVSIANQYGKFNEDGSGIWAGYTPAPDNDNADIGVKCSNCALYAGGDVCEILDFQVEPEGACRFAVIPDGYVDVSRDTDNDDMEDDNSDDIYKSDNEQEMSKNLWHGTAFSGLK